MKEELNTPPSPVKEELITPPGESVLAEFGIVDLGYVQASSDEDVS